MRKEDLRDGMILECSDGDIGILIGDRILFKDCFMRIADVCNNLTHVRAEYANIVKIYKLCNAENTGDILNKNNLELIWKGNDTLRKEKLLNHFECAINEGHKYVGIELTVPNSDSTEIIIIERDNFKHKSKYYAKAYFDNLELKTNNEIKILGYCKFNNFSDLDCTKSIMYRFKNE